MLSVRTTNSLPPFPPFLPSSLPLFTSPLSSFFSAFSPRSERSGRCSAQNWENAYLCGPSGITYEPSQEQSVAAVSSQMGLSPFEVVYDHFLGSDGTGCERRLPQASYLSSPAQKHTGQLVDLTSTNRRRKRRTCWRAVLALCLHFVLIQLGCDAQTCSLRSSTSSTTRWTA